MLFSRYQQTVEWLVQEYKDIGLDQSLNETQLYVLAHMQAIGGFIFIFVFCLSLAILLLLKKYNFDQAFFISFVITMIVGIIFSMIELIYLYKIGKINKIFYIAYSGYIWIIKKLLHK